MVPTRKKPPTKKAGAAIIEDLRKKGLITSGADPSLHVRFVSTGIPQIDDIMGGGIALDRVTMLVGLESAGKTLMSQKIAASFQEQGLNVVLVDAEMAYDERWWASTGVDIDDLMVSRPPGGEPAVDVIIALVGNVDLIIIDSGAALVSVTEQDRDAQENAQIGSIARVHKKLFDRLIGRLSGSGTAVVLINQLRADIGNPRPGSYTYPGGGAQKFWSSVIMRIRNAGTHDDGRDMGIQVIKNKVGVSGGNVVLPFKFDGSFDIITLVTADALDKNIIQHAGAWYRFPEALLSFQIEDPIKPVMGTELVQVMGRDALHRVFEEDEEAFVKLRAAVALRKGADESVPELLEVEE